MAATDKPPATTAAPGVAERSRAGSPSKRKVLRRMLHVLVVLALVGGVAAAAGLWWLATEAGLRFAVTRLQDTVAAAGNRLTLDGAGGSLYRGVTIERLEWQGGGIEASATGLVARWSLPALLRRQLLIPVLTADTVAVRLPPPERDPAPREAILMPGSLALPVTVAVERFGIGELRVVPGAAPDAPVPEPIVVSDIGAKFGYGEGRYRLSELGAVTPYGTIADAEASFGDQPPHPLELALRWRGEVERIGFDTKVTARGDLARVDANAEGTAAGAGVRLDSDLAPLAPMPLRSAKATISGLDLRSLRPPTPPETASPLPQTLIDAQLSLAPEAAGETWTGTVSLRNAASGVLSSDKLPVIEFDTRVDLRLPADPLDRQLRLHDLALVLPAPLAKATPAGAQATPAPARGNQAAEADGKAPAVAATSAARGRISGAIDVFPGKQRAIAGMALPEVKAALDFDAIDVALFMAQLPTTALAGNLSVDRNAFALDLSQSADRIRSLMPAALASAAGAAEVAVRGRIEQTALRLDEARIRLGESRLGAVGMVGLTAPHRIGLKGDARRIDLAQWLPPDTGIDPRWRNGRINADWSVEGTIVPGLDAALTLKVADSTLAGKPLGADIRSRLMLSADWAPQRLEKIAVDIRLGSNRVQAHGALGKASDQLSLDLTLPEPELLAPDVRGRLSLSGAVSGAFDRMRARASVRGDRLRLAQPEGEIRVGTLRIDANAPVSTAFAPQMKIDATIAARSIEAAGRSIDSVDLNADGTLASHRFSLAAAGEGQALKLNGTGQAKLDGIPSWRARLAETSVDGTVPVRLTAPADIRLDANSALIERLRLAIAGGEVNLNRLALGWAASPSFNASGNARGLPITELLEIAAADPEVKALQALLLDADWDLAGSSEADLSGTASVALREVARDGSGAGAAGNNAGAGSGSSLGLSGENGGRVKLRNGKLDGRFELSLPSLAFTHPLTAPEIVIDGRLQLTGSVGGTVVRPLWNANLNGSELSLLQRSVGWRLTEGKLAARLEGREFKLQTLSLQSGEGTVELQGGARLLDRPRPTSGAKGGGTTLSMDGRFQMLASRFNVPIGPGQRVALSGSTEFVSDAGGLSLRGKLLVDHGIIEIQGSAAPALPDDVTIISASTGKPTAGPQAKEGKAASPIRIATELAVDLGERLRVTGNGIAARLTGSLRLFGMLPEEPRVTGLVNIVDGSYQAYGQNLRIEKGAVRFNGPVDNPALDVVAKRPFLPVEVGVAITGTARAPKIALVSTPEMSETEKLSWLVLGVDPKEAPSAAQSLALRQAATALLVDDDGSYKPGVAQRLGLDVLNFGYGSNSGPVQGVTESKNPTGLPGAGTGTSSASAAQREVVTLGKRIGSRLFVSYEQGVRGLYNLLRIQYMLTQRLSVRAQSGSDSALDMLYSYSFD